MRPIGYHHSEETKKKIANAHMGMHLSEETKRKLSKLRKGKPLSEERIMNLIKAHTGERNGRWKGGINPLDNSIRKSKKHEDWRKQVFERDKWLCQNCFTWENLEVHHPDGLRNLIKKYGLKTFEDAMNCIELWTLDRGITLCEPCHNKIPKRRKEKPCHT